MAKNNLSEEMVVPFDDGSNAMPELEKEAEEGRKQVADDIEEAEKLVDEVNHPKDTDTPEEVELPITESLKLNESVKDNLFYDLSDAIVEVLTRYSIEEEDIDDIAEIINSASEYVIAGLDYLVEKLEDTHTGEKLSEDAGISSAEIDFYSDYYTKKDIIKDIKQNCGLPKSIKVEVLSLDGPAGGNPLIRLTGPTDKLKAWLSNNGYGKGTYSMVSLDEEFKITMGLDSYEPWSGAVDTWNKISDANMIDELDDLLEDLYPEGLSETELNDILWFESDWILSTLGLEEAEEEEE